MGLKHCSHPGTQVDQEWSSREAGVTQDLGVLTGFSPLSNATLVPFIMPTHLEVGKIITPSRSLSLYL